MAERCTFSSLRDFLYVELGKSIAHGNAPRQCQLCGHWFLHELGDRDAAIEQLKAGLDAALVAQVIERLKEELNRQ